MIKLARFLALTVTIVLFASRLPAQRSQHTGLQAIKTSDWKGLNLKQFLGSWNVTTGVLALNSCTTCYENVADGYQAMYSCTTCNSNVGVGFQAMYGATTSGNNTAVGWAALNIGNGNGNAAFGAGALESNASGSNNTALGTYALTGSTGSNNVAVGSGAFANAASETFGTAIGTNAMSESHASSGYNVAIGYNALFGYVVQGQGAGNTGSFNLAAGSNAMKNNAGGTDNVALGYDALYQNGAGNFNTVSGVLAMDLNSSGSDNVGAGFAALYSNTTGGGNTGIGLEALFANTTGSNNTALGLFANTGSGALTNAMALGANSIVSASNQVVIGNSSVTSIGGYANWTNFSDGRYKKNIQQNVPGLAFINKLSPVTYTLDIDGIEAKLQQGRSTQPAGAESSHRQPAEDAVMKQAMREKSAVTYTGFVAQEVEKAAGSMGFVFSGVDKPKDINQSFYGLRYADFVPPLVKAVQELSANSDRKDSAINALQLKFDSLQTQLTELRAMLVTQRSTTSAASLDQNAPNPFSGSTAIGYTVPKSALTAQMQITDASGKVLALIPLSTGGGKNILRADVTGYAAGTYNYSLIIDGRLAGTKQMIAVR